MSILTQAILAVKVCPKLRRAYRFLEVSENSGLGNTSKIDLTVIWRGTIVNVFKLVYAL